MADLGPANPAASLSWLLGNRRLAWRLGPNGRLLLAAALLFGASWPAVKLAYLWTAAAPMWLAASRSTLACVTVTVLLAWQRRLRWPSRADLPAILAVGSLQLSGFFALCHLAVRLVPAGHMAILSNAAVIWVVPLAAMLGQREPPSRWSAAAVTLLGTGILIRPWAVAWTGAGQLLGYALLLAAAWAWACAIVTTKVRPPRMQGIELLPWAFGLSSAILLTLAAILEPEGTMPPAAWPFALFNGMIVAPFGTYCLVELSRRLTPTVASASFMLIPVTGLILSSLVLQEPIDSRLIVGGGVIITGVMLAGRRP